MQKQKTILLLGSGLMAQTVVDYLLKRPENRIIIASNIISDAEILAKGKPNCKAVEVDVTNPKSLSPLVKCSDIVISYVPWTLHLHIAKVCIAEKKNLVTASYIQPAMLDLNEEVVKNGLTFLNEVGVDPGIDHIATMKVVDECAEKGDKIVEYESFCGGLPSPEFCDNPLGYKFSWSPIGALLALKNDAVFLQNGVPKNIHNEDLLYNSEKKEVNMSLNLEGYPNRDSTKYKELYRLNDCQNLIRGTLRYYGFSMIINSMKALNLLNKEDKIENSISWFELLDKLTANVKGISPQVEKITKSLHLDQETEKLVGKILTKTFQNSNYKGISESEMLEKTNIIINAYQSLGFFDKKNKTIKGETYLSNLVKILEKSCTLGQGETDMLVMQHKFKIQQKDGNINNKKSVLICIGQKNGFSAMAITVGTPTAIATQLILDGKIQRKGVLMPNHKDIYLPLFDELSKLGLMCKEYDNITPSPKL